MTRYEMPPDKMIKTDREVFAVLSLLLEAALKKVSDPFVEIKLDPFDVRDVLEGRRQPFTINYTPDPIDVFGIQKIIRVKLTDRPEPKAGRKFELDD